MATFIPAAEATAPIKKMLRGNGGSVQIRIGNSTRILSHNRAVDRPLTALPWPLNLLQARSFRYSVYEGEVTVEQTTFKRGELNSAISKLLEGIPPDQDVLLMAEGW
jgi:hypothetical protein